MKDTQKLSGKHPGLISGHIEIDKNDYLKSYGYFIQTLDVFDRFMKTLQRQHENGEISKD